MIFFCATTNRYPAAFAACRFVAFVSYPVVKVQAATVTQRRSPRVGCQQIPIANRRQKIILSHCPSALKTQIFPARQAIGLKDSSFKTELERNRTLFPEGFLRKEVIQPHLPIRLPCYDFTPIIYPTFDGWLLAVTPPASGVVNSRGVTGGVYKTRERIHRGMLIRDY